MLVLTRKSGEKITIGDDIVVTVLEIKGSQVKLGIEAPRSVQVYREELYQKLVESNRAATTVESEQLESWLRELGDED